MAPSRPGPSLTIAARDAPGTFGRRQGQPAASSLVPDHARNAGSQPHAMSTQRPRPATPAYRRLSQRQARRVLAPVAAICALLAGASLATHALRDAELLSVTWTAALTVTYAVLWVVA